MVAVANPFTNEAPRVAVNGALVQVEQQRAIAEVQARMIIARSNPRDSIRATDAILQDCTRVTLAEQALYQYSRGGSSISGPSIRLAEAIARRWGNIASGIKELSRSEGYSDCVAYAWDLETGYYDERQFQVRHWRDTKKGGYQLTDERDIYELIANMGQRRKRAVLLTVIPGDVVEAAVSQCEATQHAIADTTPEALKRIIEAFSQYGVSKEQLEVRCQCHFEAIRPAQVIQLRRIFTSLKEGMSDAGDWFPIILSKVEQTASSIAAADIAKATAGKPRRAESVVAPTPPPRQSAAPGGDDLRPTPLDSKAPERPETLVVPDFIDDDTPEDDTNPPVEIWPIDELSGEVASDPEYGPFTPIEFAGWFRARLFKTTNPEALFEHNADNITDARTDPIADRDITDALARHFSSQEETKRVVAPPARKPVVARTPKGLHHDGNYRTAAKAEVSKLADEADIADWVKTNQPTYKNKAVEISIGNWLRDRRKELGIFAEETRDKSPEDQHTAAVRSQQLRDALLSQLSILTDQEEITAWAAGPPKEIMREMRASDPLTWREIVDAVNAKEIELKGTPE